MLPFTEQEYTRRNDAVRRDMERRGVEVLVVADPANMNYLTGYDGWSFCASATSPNCAPA